MRKPYTKVPVMNDAVFTVFNQTGLSKQCFTALNVTTCSSIFFFIQAGSVITLEVC